MNVSSDDQVAGVDPGSAVGPDAAVADAAVADSVDPAAVEHARAHLPAPAAVADVADVLSLLGEPHRLTLLLTLRGGELCVHDLALTAGQSESATSHALKLLRAHRVVTPRREGRRMYYRLEDPHVLELLDLALTPTAHSPLRHPERGEGA